jgi:hypothetical protein
MSKLGKLISLFLSIFILQACTFIRSPKDHPLIVTCIRQSAEEGYNIYTIKDTNPSVKGWGEAAMYIELKDKHGKFEIGDAVVFNKK